MPRPAIDTVCDLSVVDNKRRLMTAFGGLQGMYEINIKPRKPTRTLQQNAYWHSCIVRPFYEFLREQDYDIICQEDAHAILKEKFMRVPVCRKRTGVVVSWRTRSTTELSTEEMADLIDRAIAWLADRFNIIVPEPDSSFAGAKAHA